MIKIKTVDQDHYLSFAPHHTEEHKKYVVSKILQSLDQNERTDKWIDDTNHNCGPSFIINIIDTEDDGFPYPDVEDYIIPNDWATPKGLKRHKSETVSWAYWFKANYIPSYDDWFNDEFDIAKRKEESNNHIPQEPIRLSRGYAYIPDYSEQSEY